MLKLSLTVIGTPCSGPTGCTLGQRPVGGAGVLQGALAVVDDDGVDGGLSRSTRRGSRAAARRTTPTPAHGPGELPRRPERERGQRIDSTGPLGHGIPRRCSVAPVRGPRPAGPAPDAILAHRAGERAHRTARSTTAGPRPQCRRLGPTRALTVPPTSSHPTPSRVVTLPCGHRWTRCAEEPSSTPSGVHELVRAPFLEPVRIAATEVGSWLTASSAESCFAASRTSSGTHSGKGCSRFRCAPDAVCSSWIAARRSTGNRSARQTSAGHRRRWMSVTLPFTSLVRTTSGKSARTFKTSKMV